MLSTILFLAVSIVAGLLIGTVIIDRRIQTDLEADVARERQRADTLDAYIHAEQKKVARLRVELREAKTARLPVLPTIDDAELDRLFNDPAAIADAAELPEISDAELEKLFAE